MLRHEDVQPLLTDYVLGELEPAKRQRVEAHLAGCGICTAEARELSLAFHSVGLAEEPTSPPPHLKARVLQRLAGDEAVTTPARASAAPTRARMARLVAVSGIAAALLVALAAALALSLQRNTRIRAALGDAEADAKRLAAEMAETRAQADLVVSILTAADMRRIDLTGFEASREATARAYWSPTQGLLIVANELPPPPPGRVYQVWLIGGGAAGPVSAGLIAARGGGRGLLIVPPPPGVAGQAVTVAVTDEPPGGLPSPTGSKRFIGS